MPDPELLLEITPSDVLYKIEPPAPELLLETKPKRVYKVTTLDESSTCSSCNC
jgi:hypothetical protein